MRVVGMGLHHVGENLLNSLAQFKRTLLETRPGIIPSLGRDDCHADTVYKRVDETVLIGFVLKDDATDLVDSLNVIDNANRIAHILS